MSIWLQTSCCCEDQRRRPNKPSTKCKVLIVDVKITTFISRMLQAFGTNLVAVVKLKGDHHQCDNFSSINSPSPPPPSVPASLTLHHPPLPSPHPPHTLPLSSLSLSDATQLQMRGELQPTMSSYLGVPTSTLPLLSNNKLSTKANQFKRLEMVHAMFNH